MVARPSWKTLGSEEDYTIGWIAALPIEAAAGTAMLDERHHAPKNFKQSANDNNSYTFGCVGEHNIVIAQLPEGAYGTTSALATGMPMLNTFSNIKFGCLVGIGGGVPNETHDVRLGDVVVSRPAGKSPGVFQYDLGKAKGDVETVWERTGLLSRPPDVLLKAMGKMMSEHELYGSRIPEFLEKARKDYPRLAKQYVHPGADYDRLYESLYHHKGTGPCVDCDLAMLVPRDERDSEDSEVHYGIIASGNSLVKDARLRDRIAAMESNCLCLDMEAAGLMNHFPCLVIRGISDYADSHKNDRWQRYAAATAAACAKELLTYVPRNEIGRSTQADIANLTTQIAKQNQIYADDKIAALLKALNDHGGSYAQHKERNPERVPGTCEWFTSHNLFTGWLEDTTAKLLWVTADPGCGKSVLSKHLIDNVLLDPEVGQNVEEQPLLCYFFFKDDFPDQRSATGAICAILLQLFTQRPELVSDSVLKEFSSRGPDYIKSFQTLWKTLISVASASNTSIVCILDALDECQEIPRLELIQALSRLDLDSDAGRDTKIKFLVTSRPYSEIISGFRDLEARLPTIHLKGDGQEEAEQISKEINLVIHANVDRLVEQYHLSDRDGFKIYEYLTRNRHRTYLWVYLTMNELEKSKHLASGNIDRMLLEAGGASGSVDGVYEVMLNKSPNHKWARELLQVIVAAYRPQTVSEVTVAMRIINGIVSQRAMFNSLPPAEKMWETIRSTCGLFISMVDSKVYLIHQTAKEFLVPGLVADQRTSFDRITQSAVANEHTMYTPWKHSFRLDKAHSLMAQVCLRFLQLEDPTDDNEKFWTYCSQNLYAHLYESDLDSSSSVVQEALALLGTRLIGWWDAIIEHMPWFQGGNAKYNPDNQDSLLARVAYLGVPSMVKRLLDDSGVSEVNMMTSKNWSPLHLAAVNGHEAVMQILIQHKAKVNIRGSCSETPVWAAIEGGSYSATSLLLASGGKPNRIAEDSKDVECAPLLCATKTGRYDLVQLLLDNKADPNNWFIWGGVAAPLKHAITLKRLDLVEILLDRGAYLSKPLRMNATNTPIADTMTKQQGRLIAPLLLAIKLEAKDIVELLIKRGAKVNSRTHDGMGETSEDAPLAFAVHYSSLQIIQLLLDNRADVNAGGHNVKQPDCFVTPLLRGIRYFKLEAVKLLLQYGARFDAIVVDTAPGKKPLRTLEDITYPEALIPEYSNLSLPAAVAIRLFLHTAGIPFDRSFDAMLMWEQILDSIEETAETSMSLIARAIRAGHLELAKVLVLGGRTVQQLTPDERGRLLTIAAQAGDLELVRQTLDAGTFINATEMFKHRTALSLVACNGRSSVSRRRGSLYPIASDYKGVARMLLSRGANQFAKDIDGKTAADLAKLCDNPWYDELVVGFVAAAPRRTGSVAFSNDTGSTLYSPSEQLPPLRTMSWESSSISENSGKAISPTQTTPRKMSTTRKFFGALKIG